MTPATPRAPRRAGAGSTAWARWSCAPGTWQTPPGPAPKRIRREPDDCNAAESQRCDSAALASALRDQLVHAAVVDHDMAGHLVGYDSTFGRLTIKPIPERQQVLVRRPDDTD